MPKRRSSITAAELLAQLNADPEWRARQQANDRYWAEREAASRLEEDPLVQALAAVGVQVESAWNLKGPLSAEASRVLLQHLSKPYDDAIRAGIARALALVHPSLEMEVWRALVEEFKKEKNSNSRTKEGLADSLDRLATDAHIEELIDLVGDTSHGTCRILMLDSLKKSSRPEAQRALTKLASDPVLAKEIAAWQRKKVKSLKKRRTRPSVKPANLAETSANFDMDSLEPFLRQLSADFRSFGAAEVKAVLDTAAGMDVEEECELEFAVEEAGRAEALYLNIHMDDMDAPDLYFFGSPSLIKKIAERIEAFFDQ